MKNVTKLSEQDLKLGGKSSWHDQYKSSAWIFVGGLPYDLTEGDVLCVFSQYGEIVNVNLVRDKATGKSKGFAFICYEDQRSTVPNTDNESNNIFYHQFLISLKKILYVDKNNPVYINFMFFLWEYLKFAMNYSVFCYDNVLF